MKRLFLILPLATLVGCNLNPKGELPGFQDDGQDGVDGIVGVTDGKNGKEGPPSSVDLGDAGISIGDFQDASVESNGGPGGDTGESLDTSGGTDTGGSPNNPQSSSGDTDNLEPESEPTVSEPEVSNQDASAPEYHESADAGVAYPSDAGAVSDAGPPVPAPDAEAPPTDAGDGG